MRVPIAFPIASVGIDGGGSQGLSGGHLLSKGISSGGLRVKPLLRASLPQQLVSGSDGIIQLRPRHRPRVHRRRPRRRSELRRRGPRRLRSRHGRLRKAPLRISTRGSVP